MKTEKKNKITSPTGRIYIGKTTNLKNRFSQYRGLRCKSQPALYGSFIAHGVDSHIFEVIGEYEESILSDMEIFFISKFDSMRNGLNCTKGGDYGFMSGDDNVSKRPEVRAKMVKAKKDFYDNGGIHPMTGILRSDETKAKIKAKRAEQENFGGAIRHLMVLDTETGLFYNSIKEASYSTEYKYKAFFYKIRYTKQTKYVLI